MWIFLKLSVILLTLVLVFVTRVLALCRDGWKQMSNLPFRFFLLKNKLWRTELMTQIQFPMHESSAGAELLNWIFLGRLSCQRTIFDEASSSRVCHHTYSDESWVSETAGLMNGCYGGRVHSWSVHPNTDRRVLHIHQGSWIPSLTNPQASPVLSNLITHLVAYLLWSV